MRATGLIIAVALVTASASVYGGALRAQAAPRSEATADAGQATPRDQQVVAQAGSREGRDTVEFGGRTIPAGTAVDGPLVVAGGDLVVNGTLRGTAVAIFADVIVGDEGTIAGDAIAIFGDVRNQGGAVAGASRSVRAVFGEGTERTRTPVLDTDDTYGALRLALGWLVVLLLIGMGVLVFAASYLEGVVDQLERSFWRSLWVGIAAELALLPGIVLLVVGLAITVIGILLIPFAVVAYVLAIAGLATLGFLAVARLTGHSLSTTAAMRLSARGGALRGLMVGIFLYLGLWVVAAIFSWLPVVAVVIRAAAFAVTWVAVSAGFGAALLSRAGTRREDERPARTSKTDEVGWQTPTPVTGVAAARRPS